MPQVYRTRFCRATCFAAATFTSPGGLHERPVEPASIQRLGSAGAPAGCRDRLSRPRQPEARHVEDAAVGSDACGLLSLLRVLSIAEPLGGLATLTGLLTQAAAAGFILVMLGAIRLKVLQNAQGVHGRRGLGVRVLAPRRSNRTA